MTKIYTDILKGRVVESIERDSSFDSKSKFVREQYSLVRLLIADNPDF